MAFSSWNEVGEAGIGDCCEVGVTGIFVGRTERDWVDWIWVLDDHKCLATVSPPRAEQAANPEVVWGVRHPPPPPFFPEFHSQPRILVKTV